MNRTLGAWKARGRQAMLPALVVGIFLVTSLLIPGYLTINSIRSILLLASLLGVAAIGQTLTIVLGGIDLSIPAIIGFADVALAQFYGDGWPIWTVMPAILAAAIMLGVINGLIVRAMAVHPLIVTLATGSILLGGILAYTHGQAGGTVPDWLSAAVSVIGTTGPIPLPSAVVLWILLAVFIIFVESCSVPGRWLYAIGASPSAARFAGLPSTLVWMLAYAVSAAFAALAGMLLAGFSSAADAGIGEPYLFMTVAAVVVGGTPMTGGRGGYARTVAGCLIITELTTLLVGLGLDQAAQEVFLGLLIVLLVSLYGRETHIRMRV